MPRDFDERFANWVYWCNHKGLHQDKAKSVEGNYRSPQVWEDRNPKPPGLVNLDIPDAILVNRAYYQLGEKFRRIIKILWFRPKWRPQWQAQKLGCHWTQLEELAALAKTLLENRLAFFERKNRITVRVSVTTVNPVNQPAGAELRSKAR